MKYLISKKKRDRWLQQSQTIEKNAYPVGYTTTECKPPRRGRFTLNYTEAHEDSEDGALLLSLEAQSPKGGLGPVM